MKRFRMTRAAKADLTEITDYIAADNPQMHGAHNVGDILG